MRGTYVPALGKNGRQCFSSDGHFFEVRVVCSKEQASHAAALLKEAAATGFVYVGSDQEEPVFVLGEDQGRRDWAQTHKELACQ